MTAVAYLDGLDASLAVDSADVDAFFDEPEFSTLDASVSAPVVVVSHKLLRSELPDVSDAAWTKFARAMRTAAVDSVSGSNALGAWEMRPKRLADLGIMTNVRYCRTQLNRLACDGDFVVPMTKLKFLDHAGVQYRVFAASMKRYVDGLADGSVAHPDPVPDDMTLSGALAILHRAGPTGLVKWGDKSKRFSDTIDLYNRTNGIF